MVIQASNDRRAKVVEAAIAALGRLGDPRGLPAVLRQVGNSSIRVRNSVAQVLPKIDTDPPSVAAVGALIKLSADSSAEVREVSIQLPVMAGQLFGDVA